MLAVGTTDYAPFNMATEDDRYYYGDLGAAPMPISTTSGLDPAEGLLGPGWKSLLLGTAIGLAVFPVMRCEPLGRCRRAALLAAGAPLLVALLSQAFGSKETG